MIRRPMFQLGRRTPGVLTQDPPPTPTNATVDRVCSPPMPRIVLERRIDTTTTKELGKIARDRRRSRRWIIPLLFLALTGGSVILWFQTSPRFATDIARPAYITFVGTVTAATIGAVISLRVFLYSPSRLRRIELLLQYVERQLGELWGPLYGLLTLSQHHYGQVLYHLGQDPFEIEGSGDEEALHLRDGHPINGVVIRRARISVDPFSLIEPGPTGGETWQRWVTYSEERALPWNDKVAKLLMKNYALIGQDHLPDLQRFLAHEAEYQALHKRVQADQEANGWLGSDYKLQALFPEAFEYHVYHKIRFLLYLQKKYRLQIEGARPRVLAEVTKKGARHREMSRSRPAERVARSAELWARESIDRIKHHHPGRYLGRTTQDSIDAVWLLAQLSTVVTVSSGESSADNEIVQRIASEPRMTAVLDEATREFATEDLQLPDQRALRAALTHLETLGVVSQVPSRRVADRTDRSKPEWVLVGDRAFTEAMRAEWRVTIDLTGPSGAPLEADTTTDASAPHRGRN